MFHTQRYKEIKKLALFNSWFLLFMALVVYHYSVLPLEVTTTQKMPSIREMPAQNAIRYLKNAIVKLDVCLEMPLDIVIFTSNPLTMLREKNKLILTMIS